jgi:uncharacterized protein YjbI with pentapeptide repeats
MKKSDCTDREQWVWERLEDGEVADLKDQYGDKEEDRQLSARFLENLLTGGLEGFQAHRRGVRIYHAVMAEAMDLEDGVVPLSVDLEGAIFLQQVNLRDADFKKHLSFNGARFSQGADLHRVKVGGALFLDGAIFQGTVDFFGADIGGQFSAEDAHFLNEKEKANFNALKVGLDTFLDHSVFQGPVDFVGAGIGRQFSAEGAQFLNEKEKADFNGLQVGDSAFFDGAVLKGGLALADARVLDLRLHGLKEPVPELSLERSVVGRNLSLENATIGKLSARNLEVKVDAAFKQVIVQDECDLRDSSFQILHLQDVEWPKNIKEVRLEGLTYKAITAGDKPRAWESLMVWVEGSRFNTQNYSELEAYFARCGHRDRADQVFIARKRRETDWLPWWKKWPVKIFWGALAAYGRKPWRAFVCSLLFILLGVFLLNPKEILTADILKNYWLSPENYWQSFCLRFFLSLNFFLPAIDLGFGKHLSLINMSYTTLAYFILHRLAGWILIPIGLAAITTRLK